MNARWLSVLAVLVLASAPAVADPLRLVPKEAGVVVVVEKPRLFAETIRSLDALRTAEGLPIAKGIFDSTPVRRFYQLVAYYEQSLGAKWPDLVDKLAGNGLALGIALADDPAPTLLVVEGTDEATVTEFFEQALGVLEAEAARNAVGNPDAAEAKVRRGDRKGVLTAHLGKEFHAARVGKVIYIANQEPSLNAGLDLAASKSLENSLAGRKEPLAARKLLGGDPLAWIWFDFAKVKARDGAKNFFEASRKDFLQTMVVGGNVDAFRRAEFVAGGLYKTADGLKAVLRLPSNRADLPADLGPLHAPPAGQPGSLPLLEPPGVVYSQSFYLDLAHFWNERKTLLNPENLTNFEKAERDVSRVIPGTSIGKLLAMTGPYHRLVAVSEKEQPYAVSPETPVPPFALVSTMRDPQFGKSASLALRAGGLLFSLQAGLKQSEETFDGVKIVSYRFPEKGKLDGDTTNLRFAFVPSFAVVGDYFVASSRPGLIKTLIPELKKPLDPTKSSAAVWRGKAYGSGASEVLRANPDPFATQAILSQGVGLDEANKQVQQLAAWLAQLGTGEVSFDHKTDMYNVQFEWKK